MITSTFSFIRAIASWKFGGASRPIPIEYVATLLIGLAAATVACGEQPSKPLAVDARKPSPNRTNTASSQATPSAELLGTLEENFNRAVRGASMARSRMAEMPASNSSGIVCSPATIDTLRPSLQIVLPPRKADRDGVLAAIVPDGSLRIIYIAYGSDVETVDIIIPSDAIDWESARKFNVFDVDGRSFDALVPDAIAPSPLFQHAGVYQLALLDGFSYEIPTHDKKRFRIKAGCVVHWSP